MEDGYDFLTIGNGKEATAESKMVALSGRVNVRVIRTTDENAWIQIVTDRSGSASGFDLLIGQVAANSEGNSITFLLLKCYLGDMSLPYHKVGARQPGVW